MSHRWCAFALVMLLGATARAADEDWAASPRVEHARERVSLSVSNRAGLVKAPFVTTEFPEVSGFGSVLTSTAAVRVSSHDRLRLELPVSFVRLDFPARAQVSETALGNLELGFEHRSDLDPSTRLELNAALLAPSAGRGPKPALLDNRALALGNALNGGKDAPLLTPGVTGFRLGASVERSLPPFELRASIDMPLLVRLSDAALPESAETHTLGLLPALELKAAWWLTSRFGVSLAGGLVMEPWRVQEPTRERDRQQRVQPVVEPGLHLQLGQHVALGLDANVPVAGALGGDAWSIGLHARLGL